MWIAYIKQRCLVQVHLIPEESEQPAAIWEDHKLLLEVGTVVHQVHHQLSTRNPKPETGVRKLETQNSKPETRNPKLET